jgi:hypothetical protein
MAIQQVNLGTYANDGTGDDLRTAFTKVNSNFSELDNLTIVGGTNLGAGSPVFATVVADAGTGSKLSFRSLVAGTNIAVTNNSDTITFTTTGTITANLTGNVTGNVTGNLTGNVTGNVTGNLTGNVTGQVSDITNHPLSALSDVSNLTVTEGQFLQYQTGLWRYINMSSDIIPEGSNNQYYTQGRFDNAFAAKTTTNLSEGSNLYYTTTRANTDFDTRLATKTTSNLSEGSNLYYTTTRANTDFDTRLATKTTSNISEGSNLYHTVDRVRNAISVSGVLSYSSATGIIGYAGPDLSSYATTTYVNTQLGLKANISSLATVATSGSYNDLNNKPTSILNFGITDGANGQVLTTNGSGVFSFTTITGGSGGDLDFGSFTSPSGFTLDLGTI